MLKPKHLISPYTMIQPLNEDYSRQEEFKNGESQNGLSITHPNCVVDAISGGQTITLSEKEVGNLKYRENCPTTIAQLIQLK